MVKLQSQYETFENPGGGGGDGKSSSGFGTKVAHES